MKDGSLIRQRLVSGTLSNGLVKLVTVSTWFVLTPFILEEFGSAAYGLWVLMTALTSYGLLLDFGIGSALVKYVAEHDARDEHDTARAMVASAVWLYLTLALVALTLGALAAPVLPGLLGVGAEQQTTAARLVLLTGLHVALTVGFTPSLAVLRGLQRYEIYNGILLGNAIFEAAGVTTALVAGWGLIGMSAVLISSTVAAGVVSVFVVRHIAPELRYQFRGGNRPSVRRIAALSASMFVIDIASRLQSRTAEFVIASASALAAVTPYALARKLGELSEIIATQFVKVVMPLASALDARDQAAQLRRLYIVSSRIALATAVPICATFVILGGTILTLWIGPAYARHADLVAVLAIVSLIVTSQWPALEILQGTGRHRLAATTALAAGVSTVGLSLVLLPMFGLLGVAFGSLIPTTAASLGVVMPFTNRALAVSWRAAATEVWMPALLPGAGAAAALWSFHRLTAGGAIATASGVAVALLIYVAGYLSMPAAAAERRLLTDIVTAGRRRVRRLSAGRLRCQA